MEWFNALVTVDRQFRGHEDDLLDRLEGFHAALSSWPDGRVRARSLAAESMIDAAAQALVIVRQAAGAEPIALELLTEPEFCDREGARG